MTTNSSAQLAIAERMPSALIARAALASAVAIAFLPVERRNTIPILSNLALQGDGGKLSISGTDLDCQVTVHLDAAADSDFSTTIEGAKFRDILAKAKTSEHAAMDILSDERLKMDLGGIQFTVQTLPLSDFPILATPCAPILDEATGEWKAAENLSAYRIATKDLKTAFERCKFAISTEENRYYLNGIYIHGGAMSGGGHGLHFVATDGHRLAKFETAAIALPIAIPGVILPRRTVDIFLKALWQMTKAKSAPDYVDVELTAARIKFTLGNVDIVSKLIDGTYPDYGRVIPRYNDKVAGFNCKAFSEAVEQVSLISMEKGRTVKFQFENGTCKFSVTNGAESAETVLQGTYSAEPLDVGLNSYYVKNMIDEFVGDEFTFTMAEAGCPVLVHDLGEPRLLCIIMPMRV